MTTTSLHRRLPALLAILLPLAPAAALAQHAGHAGHQASAPAGDRPPEREGASDAAADADGHAAMDHSKVGHSEMDHSKMDHSKMDHAARGHDAAGDAPREPIPPLTDADRAAAFPQLRGHHAMHGEGRHRFFVFNRLEAFDADPGTGFEWEGQGWIGGDVDRLWLRSEGERKHGETEAADLELLYGRGVSAWWDVVAGIRHDFKPGASQTFAALGVQGLAPYWFEISATAYLGEGGQTAATVEAEYELLLSNRLILQPLVEVEFYGKDDPARGIGAGLANAEAGLRLRYEFTRKFAPYVGIAHERAYGDTADLRRAAGEDVTDTRFVIGLRTWF